MVSSQDILDKELQHIKTALQACQFPNWALNQWHHRILSNNQTNNNNHTNNNNSTNQEKNPTKRNITVVIPFIPGISEKFKRLCNAKGIQVHYKGTNTLRTLLGNPKDKDPKTHRSGIIYHYKCPEAYTGESGRALGDRVKEHFKAPPLSINTAPQQDIYWTWTFLTSYIRKFTIIPGLSRKLCSSISMTPH